MSTDAAELVGLPVRWSGIRLGRVTDVVVDRPPQRVLGLEVRCLDRRHRFLPFAACVHLGAGRAVVPTTPLALLDGGPLAYYREHGVPLSELGREDGLAGRPGAALRVAADGSVEVVAAAEAA